VTRIISPLKTDDDIRIPGQQINDLSLAFIPPLGAYNHNIGHIHPHSALSPVKGAGQFKFSSTIKA
jgi:hypothetical protein